MIDLEPIKKRLGAATPGPWRAEHKEVNDLHWGPMASNVLHRGDKASYVAGQEDPDWELIAHAKEDVAELVAEVERLRAVLMVAVEHAVGPLDDADAKYRHVVLVATGCGEFFNLLSDEGLDEYEDDPGEPVHYLFDRRECGL